MLDSIFLLMETKKDKKIVEEIEIPEGISVIIGDNKIIAKKNNEEIYRNLNPKIKINREGNKIILSCRDRKKEKKIFWTIIAHIKNIFKGFEKKFKYKLQAVFVHFPMSISYDKENRELIVKNFLGEKKDRKIKIIEGVDVKVNKDVIELESTDIEKAGLMASKIEKETKIRKRDRRVFQDGIFIVEKPKKSYL